MSWAKEAQKNLKLLQEDATKVARESFIQLGSNIVTRSPVNTGRFRSNWLGAYGTYDTTTTEKTDVDSVGEMIVTLNGLTVGDVFYFTNSLPYALRLEYGYSEQAPSGVVRLSVRGWRKIVDTEIKRLGNK